LDLDQQYEKLLAKVTLDSTTVMDLVHDLLNNREAYVQNPTGMNTLFAKNMYGLQDQRLLFYTKHVKPTILRLLQPLDPSSSAAKKTLVVEVDKMIRFSTLLFHQRSLYSTDYIDTVKETGSFSAPLQNVIQTGEWEMKYDESGGGRQRLRKTRKRRHLQRTGVMM
jgi:primosomal protein N''